MREGHLSCLLPSEILVNRIGSQILFSVYIGSTYKAKVYPWLGFPDGAVVKDHLPMQETQGLGSNPWVGSPLQEEVVPHSSILAWRIPWTEEPGGLQSVGSQELDMTDVRTHR